MTPGNSKFRKGLTLLELVIAILVLAVAAAGTLNYQFHTVRQARIANNETIAVQTAQLLIEDWKSSGGDENYDPSVLQLGFTDFAQDKYLITVSNLPMLVTLSWQDISVDPVSGTTLRKIRSDIQWQQNSTQGNITDADARYTISTYVRRDEASG